MTTTFTIVEIHERAEARVRSLTLDLTDAQQAHFLVSSVEKDLKGMPIADLREFAQSHAYTYVKGNVSRAKANEIVAERIMRDLRETQRKARTYTTTFAQMQTLARIERQDYFLSDAQQDGENLIVSLGSLSKDDLTITIYPSGDTAVSES